MEEKEKALLIDLDGLKTFKDKMDISVDEKISEIKPGSSTEKSEEEPSDQSENSMWLKPY